MVSDSTTIGTYRETVHIGKWQPGRTPQDGPPDEEVAVEGFFEPDGTLITDPQRIAQVRAAQERDKETKDAQG